MLPRYYNCGCCGAWHRDTFNGDCRNDAHRHWPEEIDALHGAQGWEEVEQEDLPPSFPPIGAGLFF